MNLSVCHEPALLGCFTFLLTVVAPLDQLYFFYHLKLDVSNFCKLNTNRRETFIVKTLAPTLIPTAPTMYSSFIVILGVFDSSSITFTRTIKMCYS